ncbi:unnamed protein product [Gongylonema pulchrum]|uniref:Uncharacterized protein n=1 Tax=Gongylonema pulchrum TaxID=637853 RepID=A0A183EH58_9BILA|nr:unnamed protein product [Gongylonema pulchrum]
MYALNEIPILKQILSGEYRPSSLLLDFTTKYVLVHIAVSAAVLHSGFFRFSARSMQIHARYRTTTIIRMVLMDDRMDTARSKQAARWVLEAVML